MLTGINHLAFITNDMKKTIRFYRDLLEMELNAGVGHDGFRHYFFKFGDAQVAFFEYAEAKPMARKNHGTPTNMPLGFDHVSFTVESRKELFWYKDRLEAAGIKVNGAVDHGTMWSIYFFDPNNIPLEISWNCMEVIRPPAMSENNPMPIVAEGSKSVNGVWPEVVNPTIPAQMVAYQGSGYEMRETFLQEGTGCDTSEYRAFLNGEDK